MSLSITNAAHITQAELDTITRWNATTEILVVNTAAEGGPKIETLSKEDLNLWQLFLRLLNMGKLAKLKLDLSEVSLYVNQYDWSVAASDRASQHGAYLKVCNLANKAMLYKREEALFNNVSIDVGNTLSFCQYRGAIQLNKHELGQTFKWNPALQAKHLEAFLKKQFERVTVRVELGGSPITGDTNVTGNDVRNANFFVDQHLSSLPFLV